MRFICMIIKNHFHKKGFSLGLLLKQKLASSRKWPIRYYTCWYLIISHHFVYFSFISKNAPVVNSTCTSVVLARSHSQNNVVQSATMMMKKCCSHSLSILILFLAKMHHATFKNKSDFFSTTMLYFMHFVERLLYT